MNYRNWNQTTNLQIKRELIIIVRQLILLYKIFEEQLFFLQWNRLFILHWTGLMSVQIRSDTDVHLWADVFGRSGTFNTISAVLSSHESSKGQINYQFLSPWYPFLLGGMILFSWCPNVLTVPLYSLSLSVFAPKGKLWPLQCSVSMRIYFPWELKTEQKSDDLYNYDFFLVGNSWFGKF